MRRLAMQETAHQEARAKNISKKTGMHDKRNSLTEAMERYLKDGINIGIGGFANNCIPVASIHEIIRQGAHNLTLTIQSNSICCELLAGAMILNPDHLTINKIELALLGSTIFGNAPLLRHLANNNMIQMNDYTSYDGSDMAPPCRPDLLLIHVQTSDMYGNSQIFGDSCSSVHGLTQSSVTTLVTTEQIIQSFPIAKDPNLTKIPFDVVDAVVDQPFGATPGACHGHYWFDISEIQEFTEISEDFCKTGNKQNLKAYFDKYIFDMENFDDLLEQKPYPILQQLCLQDEASQFS